MSPSDPEGRYLHWDQFRFKTPARTAHDLTEAWQRLKLIRFSRRAKIPLFQKTKRRFSLVDVDRMKVQLHRIDTQAGAVFSTGHDTLTKSSAERFLYRSILEEPFSSSVLEGAATTRAIARQMIEQNRAPRTRDERMVLNNYHAMRFIKENAANPLMPEMVLELHRIITADTLDNPGHSGRFRAPGDDINVVDDTTNEILHAPPPASELPERLAQFCTFANRPLESQPFIHPVVHGIILHFMLAYDHPFADGNGRAARALFYWAALRAGYWLFEYVSISAIIKEAPIKYGQAFLYVETDDGDLTYFIDHQMGVIERAIASLHKYLDRQHERAAAIRSLAAMVLNERQAQVLRDALKSPSAEITIAAHQERTGVSYLTARKDLEELADKRMLIKSRAGARSMFRLSDRARKVFEGKV